MDFVPAQGIRPGIPGPVHDRPLIPLKILVAGGSGVGKATFVASLSEISPLSTKQEMTALSVGV
jgi:uncharacterized protein